MDIAASVRQVNCLPFRLLSIVSLGDSVRELGKERRSRGWGGGSVKTHGPNEGGKHSFSRYESDIARYWFPEDKGPYF